MVGGIDDVHLMKISEAYSSCPDPYSDFMTDTTTPGQRPIRNQNSTAVPDFMCRPTYDDDIQMREAFVNWILSRPPSYEPRLKFVYSNFGYGLVGAVLEKEHERIFGLEANYVRKSFNEINQESLKGLGMEDNYGTKNGHAGT